MKLSSSTHKQIQRFAALLLLLFNRSQVSKQEIFTTVYGTANTQDAAARKQYQRDLRELAAHGVYLIHTKDQQAQDEFLSIDARQSFSRVNEFSGEELRFMTQAGAALLQNPSYPLIKELQTALAKLGTAFSLEELTETLQQVPHTSSQVKRIVAEATMHHQPLHVDYIKRDGTHTTRTIVPWGMFALTNDEAYIVASPLPQTDVPHTYRLSSFTAAQTLPLDPLHPPKSFSLKEYIKLPFQIGAIQGRAQLYVAPQLIRDAWSLIQTNGYFDAENHTWSVDYAQVEDLVRWAIALGMKPRSPQDAAERWQELIDAVPHSTSSLGNLEEPRAAKPRNLVKAPCATRPRQVSSCRPTTSDRSVTSNRPATSGRPTVSDVLDFLLSYFGTLQAQGDTVYFSSAAALIGKDADEVRAYIEAILQTALGYNQDEMWVDESDHEAVSLFSSDAYVGKSVRLTAVEAQALIDALRSFNPSETYTTLETAVLEKLAPTATVRSDTPVTDTADQRTFLQLSEKERQVSTTCIQAIARHKALTFWYQKSSDAPLEHRHGIPLRFSHHGYFYLVVVYDLDREALRSFRLDSMSDLELVNRPAHAPEQLASSVSGTSTSQTCVILASTCDTKLLHGINYTAEELPDGCLRVCFTFIDHTIIQRLAALADHITVDDPTLLERIHSYQQELLEHTS